MKYFKKFMGKLRESSPEADAHTMLFWFFEQIYEGRENLGGRVEWAVIQGFIDIVPYRNLIKENYPNIREAQVKNKIGEEILKFYYAFVKAFQTKIQCSRRDRPVIGLDNYNTVEYNIQVWKNHFFAEFLN